MASLTRTYTDSSKSATFDQTRVRAGRPRSPRPTMTSYEQVNYYGASDFLGSHMPIDTEIHWDWRNPLNILPALVVLLFVIALIALVFA